MIEFKFGLGLFVCLVSPTNVDSYVNLSIQLYLSFLIAYMWNTNVTCSC